MNNYKVSVVIPAGRKQYMELLIPQILRQSHSWDELQIWKNTNIPDDIAYIDSLPALHPNIKVIESDLRRNGWAGNTIYPFFRNCIDQNTIYIRFDDDVCYIDPYLIRRLAQKRWEDTESFLVSPLIINNAVCTAILQSLGFCQDLPKVQFECMDATGWKDPKFAEKIHYWFLNGGHNEIKHLNHVHYTDKRYSINCISWRGSKFAEFSGAVGQDEEQWLSQDYVRSKGLKNAIHTSICCAHYAFWPQRDYLHGTGVLEAYKAFINN